MRCKYCKYWQMGIHKDQDSYQRYYCLLFRVDTHEEWGCSFGKEKDDEADIARTEDQT